MRAWMAQWWLAGCLHPRMATSASMPRLTNTGTSSWPELNSQHHALDAAQDWAHLFDQVQREGAGLHPAADLECEGITELIPAVSPGRG